MPKFMDTHTMPGVSRAALAEAHAKDVAIQAKHGVKFTSYWVDEKSGKVWCFCEAPSREAAIAVHKEAGHPADDIFEVHEGH